MESEFDQDEQALQRMEHYFHGEMSADEQSTFENELTMNPSLKQNYNQWRLLFVGIGEASLQEKLAGFHQDIQLQAEPPVRAKTLRLGGWLMAAAAAAVLVVGVWLLFFYPDAGEKTFAAWYKPDPGLPTVMGTTDSYAFDKAMVNYKSGNYKAAITGWESLLRTDSGNDTLRYFLGSALLADGQAEKALPYLKTVGEKAVAAPSSNSLVNEAAWYTGLTLIRLKKHEEAKPFIRASGRTESQSVLKALED